MSNREVAESRAQSERPGSSGRRGQAGRRCRRAGDHRVLIALLLGGGGDSGLGDLLGGLQPAATSVETQTQPDEFQGLDDDELFVASVLGSTETLWRDVFGSASQTYQPSELVLFTDATTSACGGATEQVGPHYCPTDKTIYIDLDFFGLLEDRFGASTGEFAQAYVIAHEVAHHVQNELGIMSEMRSLQQQDPGTANSLSISLEHSTQGRVSP